jgi:hypothetical protein
MNKESMRSFIVFDLHEIAACNTLSHSINHHVG